MFPPPAPSLPSLLTRRKTAHIRLFGAVSSITNGGPRAPPKQSAFDQDISGWAVHSVTEMGGMFKGASAFDQDLGWLVADEVDLREAFNDAHAYAVDRRGTFKGPKCKSTSCGVVQVAPTCGTCKL